MIPSTKLQNKFIRILLALVSGLLWPAWTSALTPPAAPVRGRTPDVVRLSKQLLPDIIDLLQQGTLGMASERKPPRFVSISLGKDEYVYSLTDRIFIRLIKDRYELPAWRVCGDFAIVRVELMGENMESVAPIRAWYMLYREGHWERFFREEEGGFRRANYDTIVLPPYAERCFNLDNRELLDH